MRLANKIAVITGGMGQLGQHFATALLAKGASVVVLDLNVEKSRWKGSMPASEKLHFYQADISNKQEVEKVAARIVSSVGIPNVLINNAAIDAPPSAPASENGPFEDYPLESIQKAFDVNVLGTVICCQVFGKQMISGKVAGSIINISSIYGMVSPVQDIYAYKSKGGSPWFKPVAYSITKSAILNLTRYLATYWGKNGIRVNTISPAGIFNNQDKEFLEEYHRRIPIGRMAKPEEIAEAVLFLAGDGSSYMTGSNMVVDGGWTAW